MTATLGLDLPSNSSNSDVQTELAVKNLSADEAIHMLALYPDKFLARTTKVCSLSEEYRRSSLALLIFVDAYSMQIAQKLPADCSGM